MAERFYAVKIEDLVTREFWDIVPAANKGEAFEISVDTWTKYGGRPSKVRRATPAEIKRYKDMQIMTREEFIRHERY